MIPKLQFDFKVNEQEDLQTLIFTDPVEIITTNKVNEVNISLKRVEEAISKGYYAAGYLSYEATYAFYKTNRTIDSAYPLLWFGVFKDPIVKEPVDASNYYTVGKWSMKERKEAYLQNVDDILEKLNNDETEQVNYTIPFNAPFNGDSYDYYKQLKRAQKANFNAYLQFDDFDILSVSPEKFFSIRDNIVTVRPMKGTAARGKSFQEDIAQYHWLQESEKNKKENDLIADLMRYELESIAHSITTRDYYHVEKYPTVYQMTSTLSGTLKDRIHPVNVLSTLFPCGSITGVPKNAAIDIIAKKETDNRGIYCGTIGYFTPNKEAIFNVAIRTVTINKLNETAYYNAGGAITKDSTAEDEYNEVIAKTDILHRTIPTFKLLETLLLEDGVVFLEDKHIARLRNSAQYFDYPFKEAELINVLTRLKETYKYDCWRVRLLLNEHGRFSVESFPLERITNEKVIIAERSIDHHYLYLYHKTTERTIFNEHRQLLQDDYLDVLLWNKHGEITEFTIGNVVVEKDGRLLTPPVESGLLPGTFREQLIEDGTITEEKIMLDDLNEVTSMWLINSVRKWVKVTLVQ